MHSLKHKLIFAQCPFWKTPKFVRVLRHTSQSPQAAAHPRVQNIMFSTHPASQRRQGTINSQGTICSRQTIHKDTATRCVHSHFLGPKCVWNGWGHFYISIALNNHQCNITCMTEEITEERIFFTKSVVLFFHSQQGAHRNIYRQKPVTHISSYFSP